ncbi:hypothetical protein BJ875DRAFT_389526 [Amylocarpus encephaloides]|uniref:Uncharacterized protein n=1 Tax=Amylocarpus encephaloides TaxID=45428 RepID=A0A9P7Y7W9_9HELO|nr:hypothetical protein BJ875DRAFT_389526 [Amylocarpus encephaloides]
MKGCFCPCILVGQNHARLQKGETEPDACSGWCAAWCGLQCGLGVGFILQMMDRMHINEKYNLEGGACGACCKSFLCSCCEAIQTSKELDYVQLNQNPRVGYPRQEKMVARPQGQAPMGYPQA